VDITLTLGSRIIPVPQLLASDRNSSQRLHCNSLTNSPTKSLLRCPQLRSLTELGRSRDIASERTAQETPPPTVLPLLRASRCLATSFVLLFVSRSLPSNWSICNNMLVVCYYIDFLSTVHYLCYYSCAHSCLWSVYICILSVIHKRYYYVLYTYCLCYVVMLYLCVLLWLVQIHLPFGLVALLCWPCLEIWLFCVVGSAFKYNIISQLWTEN
jgi:hypothetical protein